MIAVVVVDGSGYSSSCISLALSTAAIDYLVSDHTHTHLALSRSVGLLSPASVCLSLSLDPSLIHRGAYVCVVNLVDASPGLQALVQMAFNLSFNRVREP